MKYRALGRTGLAVSEIGLGCWQLASSAWGTQDMQIATAIPGARSPQQVLHNMAASDVALDRRTVDAILTLWQREIQAEPLPWCTAYAERRHTDVDGSGLVVAVRCREPGSHAALSESDGRGGA